jgi:uncharacterized repeat protein (TIGR01451 family)
MERKRRLSGIKALTAVGVCALTGVVLVAPAASAPARSAATYTVSIATPAPQPEGNSGSSSMTFNVSISPKVNDPQPVTVDYATTDGSATAGEDYGATSGTLTVTQDGPSQIAVEIFGDTKVETDESFSVNLSNPSANATIGTGQATGTILNDDVPPPPPPPPPPGMGPDLSLVKTTDTPTVTVGGTARFSIAVTNNGVGPATGVLVTDVLPSNLQLASIGASQGSCAGSSCSIGSLAQGATAAVSVRATATALGRAVNSASVSQSLPDPVPGNGTGSAAVDVVSGEPPPPEELPPPESGQVNVAAASGQGQCVALKDGSGCQPLEEGQQVAISDIAYIDPGKGKVEVQSIVGIGNFYGGKFNLNEINSPGQRATAGAAAKPILVVGLVGSLKQCSTKRSVAATKKPVRRLWGKGKGRFRTKGRYASGTVRGTNWLTEDYCDGTQIRVVSGVVQVYDFVLKRWKQVHPGEKYFAKAPTKTK